MDVGAQELGRDAVRQVGANGDERLTPKNRIMRGVIRELPPTPESSHTRCQQRRDTRDAQESGPPTHVWKATGTGRRARGMAMPDATDGTAPI
jgi:hypothetical protein